jgi:uncharacterized OsmC-like protein
LDAEKLRALQAPLKDRYREDPASAKWTLSARGILGERSVTCRIETGKSAPIEAGLHPATGGSGDEACSGDMLLEALAACAGVTLKAVATAMGITIRGASVNAEGDVDFRGTLGVAREVPVGFTDIRLRFDLDTDATPEQLANLIKLTERYCVNFQTLAHPPTVSVSHTLIQDCGSE